MWIELDYIGYMHMTIKSNMWTLYRLCVVCFLIFFIGAIIIILSRKSLKWNVKLDFAFSYILLKESLKSHT